MSGLINALLEDYFQELPVTKKPKKLPPLTKKPEVPPIPGVSVGFCKGNHYMSRKDCGKARCLWEGIK